MPLTDDLIRDICRRWREALGLKQGPLAKKIGVSGSTLSKWENSDKVELTGEQLDKLFGELRRVSSIREKKYGDAALQTSCNVLFDNLKQSREENGLSQARLAERAGLMRVALIMIETGNMRLNGYERERAENALRACVVERQEQIKRYQQMIESMQDVESSLRRELAEHQQTKELQPADKS
jgi:transcriptional regulator with XRE-family HTH domain